jgi:alpha-amylase
MMNKIFLSIILLLTIVLAENCSNFNDQNACQSGAQTDNDPSWINRQWQTPPRGDILYRPEYQDMNQLVGYARIVYNADRTSASVIVVTQTNPRIPNSDKLLFSFNGKAPVTSNIYNASSTSDRMVSIKVVNTITGASLILDDVYFIWSRPSVNTPIQYEKGQKGAIVEMFGWPYADIAQECEMIGKAGYLGVKVFPPQEFVVSWDQLQNGELNPWYFMYQPVSYRLNSRWGTRKDLVSMIEKCRSFGVRVYADAVVNHMAGNGNDAFLTHRNGNSAHCDYFGAKDSTAGSPYYTQGFAYKNVTYTKARPGMEFPAVPYGPLDFHCERGISSWTDPFQLNYGYLVGLCDLNTEKEYVRQRIADYFTDLLSVGFSGFRVDAAKHISPDNLAAIFRKFKNNLGGGDFPDDFITYLEVIIGGEKELLMCNPNPYNFGTYFATAMNKAGLSDSDIFKVKIWSSDYPKEFPICGSWVISSEREAIVNDCHDDQFPGSSSRDMGDAGSVLVKEKNVAKHRNFEKLLFTRTDGNWKIKLLLSSYTFMDNAFGPPDGLSDCSLCKGPNCSQCKTVKKSIAHDPNVCGYTCVDDNGQWLKGVYTRVHRDLGIILAMRQWMGLSPISAEQAGLPSKCKAL